MSLLLTYLSRKALIAENLQSMGINSASSNNGLTTLAGKILDIEPSVSGLNIETSINLRSSANTSFVGQSITFEAEVIVTYDDETVTDVDLSGVLTGATIIFKNGDNILGTGITDANGIATYTCAFNTMGNHFITATFEGTDNFVGCTSSSINVATNYSITISSNKNILSYAHNDTATISCLLSDGLGGKSGETLSYEILNTDNKLIDSGSGITNSSGEVNFTYNSSGIGDITIVVYYGNSFQKEINIEDCDYWNDGSSIAGLEVGTEVSCTSNGDYITITTSTSGEKYVQIPKQLTASDDYEYELEIAEIGSVQSMAINWNNQDDWAFYHNANVSWGVNTAVISNTAISVGDKFKIKKQGSTVTFYINDVLKHTLTKTYGNHKVGFYTNNGRVQKIKNIKLKALPSYNLSITASDNIIQSGDTTTLTATLTDNGKPVIGESIVFKNGSTVLDTVTTDSNGQAEYEYTGTGAGDITITVLYDSLEETYEIEDCLFYDDASIDNRSMYAIYDQYGNTNVGTFSYTNNQYCHSWHGNYAVLLLVESLGKLSNCEIEVTGKPTSTVFSGTVGIGLQMSGGNSYGIVYYTSQSTRRVKYPWSDSYSAYYNNALEDVGDGYYSLKIYKVGNTITLAKTNESFTITGDTHYVGIMKGTSTNCFKKLKVKALSD